MKPERNRQMVKPAIQQWWAVLIWTMCMFGAGLSPANAGQVELSRDPVKMVWVQEGPFLMGNVEGSGRDDERPQREVFVDGFYIDSVEVTNTRYLAYIKSAHRKEPPNPYGDGPLSGEKDIGKRPVVQITWYDAVDYCLWAGKRLPTEAEWEKAARGTDGRMFPWGGDPRLQNAANFAHNWEDRNTLWPVGSQPQNASPYGVLDMAGNVREWVADWYSPDYYRWGPVRNPQGPGQGILKVIRGGSWHSFAADIRTAARGKGGFALKTDGIGFRCAQSVKDKEMKEARP
ncbi:conserved exported hypothetical protein, DUF323 [Nitrospina gracilis 3/211]|uniref:Sulfatase-modifying factor enzyme-like domain-containing protein n=1 Tax=Nitrospina gracilis (strain 3/211) TaxID=1266370 RepID=M1ZA64_NITG3|nr:MULTISPECIES: formylglycine-generating enzyme family protein [Nitrospina]MCF8723075.1 formylglycine-generating enzyme required for sulfatase activity [Nitrospina sp. Nb-3]CCQ90112.1 conserved exported hypothetical protein, DUF323 [Nitrospina gracilis 3/211]